MVREKPVTEADPKISDQAGPKIYFKNLDGIRCIAAFMVIIQHMSDYKNYVGTVPNAERRFVSALGAQGVTLFFVLSGYLIFFLLFAEKKYTGSISIKDFYVRRILRIWPLYFLFGLIMILGIRYALAFLGSPAETPVVENLLFLVTFSVNLQLIFTAANKGIIELYWSVCIEEQFYLFAPWLVKKGSRIMPWIIGGLIAAGIATKFILSYLKNHGIMYFSNHSNPLSLFTSSWFDAFGFGVLAAYLYFNKNVYRRIQGIVENRYIQLAIIVLTLLYITNVVPTPTVIKTYFFSTVPALMFSFIVLAASTGNFILNLEKPLLKTLGKVSYGMYIFHAFIAQVMIYVFLKLFPKDSIFFYEILFPMCCLITVALVSWLSYEVYEKHFLRMKKRFTVIHNQKYS